MPRKSRHQFPSVATVSDQSGRTRTVTLARHNGRPIMSCSVAVLLSSEPEAAAAPHDTRDERLRRFALMAASGRFSDAEVRTMYALAIERLTIAQIAAAERCSRQAVRARLAGNSKGQGGAVKKAERFWRELATSTHPLEQEGFSHEPFVAR